MLDHVTPVLLTLNEAANLERTLGKLTWAKDIVVVDSGSSDGTAEIAARNRTVRFFTRPFDGHANQWNFAVSQTGIRMPWILTLDADYVLSDELVAELSRLEPDRAVAGYQARFVYCVEGRALRATLYPPLPVLFRAGAASYVQDGHTQRLRIDGPVVPLDGVIFHDDRKSLSAWVGAQVRYARAEADKFIAPGWRPRRWQERVRTLRVVAPFAMLFYCLFVKLLVLDGWPGVFYSFQRAFAELLLSLYLIRQDLSGRR